MSEDLQNQLAGLIEAARKAGSDAATFISEQAPDLAHQIVAWGLWSSVAGLVVAAVIGVSCCKIIPKAIKWRTEANDYGAEMGYEVVIVLMCVGITLSALLALFSIPDAVKCIVAPKLYLIEYIAQFTK